MNWIMTTINACMWHHFHTRIAYFFSWYYISFIIENNLRCPFFNVSRYFYDYLLQLKYLQSVSKRHIIYFFLVFIIFSLLSQYMSHNIKRVQTMNMERSSLADMIDQAVIGLVYLLQDRFWHSLPHTADPHCWQSCMAMDQQVFHWLFYPWADLLRLGPRKYHQSKNI